jgi:tRNA G10  N-methylase Trm11
MEEFSIEKENLKLRIEVQDVLQISKKIKEDEVDAIVCEPYLGSSKIRSFDKRRISQEIRSMESLYLKAFAEFKKILNKDGKIVMVFPVINHKGRPAYLNILDDIEKLGFEKDEYCENQEELGLNLTYRKTIVYYRPGQVVSREIIVFKLK